MDVPSGGAGWSIETPTHAGGAIAMVVLVARDGGTLDAAIGGLAMRPVAVGEVRVADLMGVDRGVIARWSERTLHLMPHGGTAVVRAIVERLSAAGIARAESIDPRARYPEASSDIEARMLDALARAASPLAIDLLLDQPRRWAAHERGELPAPDAARSRVLNRLIDPPLVVAIGPPNVGKSTLVNALAGRGVSIVADAPGTTRDHVGVMLEIDGLVLRYADTPGLRESDDPIEREAMAASAALARSADLIIQCGDAAAPPPVLPAELAGTPSISVALRRDLGPAAWAHDLAVCARSGDGLDALSRALREALVPAAAMADPRPWRW
jgi:tRNA modification GTPase